ncbi:uncharacterized protein LOC105695388 isoform X2 [Orussus abietinus]|uniref:uncharacterized protein LOC105695388 isoform X2 n=1 Tax=Orussus abietinus TaxID=222816 RepID=UPI0006259C63|nr:uncharacterized protein LOC105695388 isoform X2 [Orussus abietinus]
MAAPQASSRLEMLQARFQQKQLQEKEQKLLQLYDQQQLRAHQVAQRGSAGSTGSSNGSMVSHQTITRTTTSHSTSTSQGGKVRQMFDERRQTTVKGIDRSYPLEPLDKSRKHPIDNGVTSSRTNPLVNRHSVTVKKLVRADVNSNVNGGKPVVSYHEEMTTSFDDGTEFGDENHDDGLINGHRNSIRSEVQVEEVIDDDTIERNRMMAKIHLMGFDRTLKHRVGNNLENEQFPEDPMLDFPDKPKRTIGKKLSQAEARLERFKNANSRRTIANRTTSTSRKPADSSGSTSRVRSSRTRTLQESQGRGLKSEEKSTGCRTKPIRKGKRDATESEEKFPKLEAYLGTVKNSKSDFEIVQVAEKGYSEEEVALKRIRKGSRENSNVEIERRIEIARSDRSGPEEAKHEIKMENVAKAGEDKTRREVKSYKSQRVPVDKRVAEPRKSRSPATPRKPSEKTIGDISKIQDSIVVDDSRRVREASKRTAEFVNKEIEIKSVEPVGASKVKDPSRLLKGSKSSRSVSPVKKSPIKKSQFLKTSGDGLEGLALRNSRSESPLSVETDTDRSEIVLIDHSKEPESSSRSGNPKNFARNFPKARKRTNLPMDISPGNEEKLRKSERIVEEGSSEKLAGDRIPSGSSTLERNSPDRNTCEKDGRKSSESSWTSRLFRQTESSILKSRDRVDRTHSPDKKALSSPGGDRVSKDEETSKSANLKTKETDRECLKSTDLVRKMMKVRQDQILGSTTRKDEDVPDRAINLEKIDLSQISRTDSSMKKIAPLISPQDSAAKFSKSEHEGADILEKKSDRGRGSGKMEIPEKQKIIQDKSKEIRHKKSVSRVEKPKLGRAEGSILERQKRPDLGRSEKRAPRKAKKSTPSKPMKISESRTSTTTSKMTHSKTTAERLSPISRPQETRSSECKDHYSRTDSVESALRRFDSIGGDTDHRESPEHEISEFSPEFAKIQRRSEKITEFLKIETRDVDESRSGYFENCQTASVRERAAAIEALQAAEKSPSVLFSSLKGASSRERSRNKIDLHSLEAFEVRKSTFRPEKRGVLKARDSIEPIHSSSRTPSPACKRKLFEDTESSPEVELASPRTIDLSPQKSARRSLETSLDFPERKAVLPENVSEITSDLVESKTKLARPVTPLRSIEVIRKSIEIPKIRQLGNPASRIVGTRKARSESSEPPVSSLIAGGKSLQRARITAKRKQTETEDISGGTRSFDVDKPRREHPEVDVRYRTFSKRTAPLLRLNKSPSPDPAARKEMKNSTSTRRSTPTSPPKSPDANNRASMDLRNEPTTSRRSPPNIPRNRENRRPALETSKSTDVVDGPDLQNDSCIPERSNSQVQREEDDSNSRKRGDAFVVEFDDLEKKSRENEAPKKPAPKKRSQESATLQKQASPPTTTPRPLSSLSNSSSTGSSRSPGSVGAKGRMATKARHPAAAAGSRGPPTGRSGPGAVSNDTLVPCKVCGRRFAQDRVGLHEQICSKTGQKKRKQFDAMMFRVKGTELEPFVKKSTLKKPEPKSKKSDPKSNWRRKHEDFINAIRSAKQVQAHLAAGGKLSDLPPPPASDTSDYIQCPHCGRKFNQGAAERHIPKCQHMLHNKPNPRAPPKPKR